MYRTSIRGYCRDCLGHSNDSLRPRRFRRWRICGLAVERYQLIIFAVVVVALLVLGFFFGRWLRGLIPSATGILDAIGAAWDRFVAWISRPFNPQRGDLTLAGDGGGPDSTGIYSGDDVVYDRDGRPVVVIDVYPEEA